MKKKLLGLLATLTLILSIGLVLGIEAFATVTGSGTEEDPYVVTTKEELKAKLTESGTTSYVKLGGDIDLTGLETGQYEYAEITIKGTKTLDLAGYTLSCTDEKQLLKTVSSNLTIKDSSIGKTGIITSKDYGIYIYSGTVTLQSGTISDCLSGVDCSNSGAVFNMEGGKIIGCSYAGVNNMGTFNMSGGEISGQTANDSYGVKVNTAYGTFTMTGGKITGNKKGVVCWSTKGDQTATSPKTIAIGGSAQITGNTVQNLYLFHYHYVNVLTGENAPTEDMEIGVTLEYPGDTSKAEYRYITSNNGAAYNYFYSDNLSYDTAENKTENRVVLVVAKPKNFKNTTKNISYTTLQGAIDAAASGDTIQMLANSKENITIDSDDNITLDLNGYVLDGDNSGSVIKNNGTLAIIDSNTNNSTHKYVVQGSGLWKWNDGATGTTTDYDELTDLPETGDVIAVSGGCITGGSGFSENGGGVYNDGTLTLTSGNIIGNSADSAGGGICCNSSKEFTMNGGCIVGNISNGSSYGAGGAIYLAGNCEMTSGDISFNMARQQSGSIYIDGGTFTMTGGLISYNYGTITGGCVEIGHDGKLYMYGGTITNNIGGGINFWGAGSASLALGKNARITGNMNKYETALCNVELYSNKIITLGTGANEPVTTGNKKMYVGVTANTPPTESNSFAITDTSTKDYSACFTVDNSDYTVYNDNTDASNQVMKIGKHSHIYTSNGATITLDCSNATIPCSHSGTDKTLTIEAPTDLFWDGMDKEASFGSATSFLGDSTLPTINYEYKATVGESYTTAGDLSSIGFYKASFTVGTGDNAKTAYVEYTIIAPPPVYCNCFDDSDCTFSDYIVGTSYEVGTGNYTFAGWYDNSSYIDEALTSADEAIGGTTYYAKWTKTIDDVVYNVWTFDESMPDVGDNYVLAKDVTLDYMWVVHSGMVIALDGHTIKGGEINDNSYKLTFIICSEDDMNNAINIGTYSNRYTLEIVNDFEITEFIRLKDRYLVINGNDHTITGATGTASNSKKVQQMFAIDSVKKDSRNYVKINDLNIVCSERFKNAIAVQNKDDNKNGIHLTLTNISINHFNSIDDSAALLNFGSDITINGRLTIITGENDCYAIGMDLATQDAKLVFDDEAEVMIVDNRSDKKQEDRALIFYSSRDEGYTATVSGKYVNENLEPISDIGYNPIAAIWFETNGGGYIEPVGVAKYWLVPRPANDPERSDYTFGGWYADENCENAWNFASDKAAGNMTLYAKWIKNSEPKATVFGAVTDDESNYVDDATVELILGKRKVAATTTNSYGVYSFGDVENGLYNIVVTKDTKVKTAMVDVNQASSFDVGIIVLPSKEVSSKVELKNVDTVLETIKTDVASTVVGGIDAIAENENPSGTDKVTIKLTVEPKSLNTSDIQQKEIKNKAKDKTIEFIDLTLTKQVNEETPINIGDSNTELLTINMSFDTDGININSIMVYRYHGSKAITLQKITSEADKCDGTFELQDKNIKIYAKKFSTYAVGYTTKEETNNKVSKTTSYTSAASGKSKYNLYVMNTENGTVEVSDEKPLEGSTVTITVNPNKGYVLDTLKVNQKTGEEVEVVTKDFGRTYNFVMPSRNTEVTVTFKEGKNYFEDVSQGIYYYEPVNWAVENNITSGIDETHFGPKVITTRAQMVTFLWKLAGSPEPTIKECKFTDVVSGSYYEKAVLWAVENGITHGTTETTFSPKANIKRGQAVTLIHNYKGNKAANGENKFSDVKENAYYYNSVIWAVENGITSGTTENTFSPNEDCTRAQIVTFLYNCSK